MQKKEKIFFCAFLLSLCFLKSQPGFFQGLSWGVGYSGFDYGTGNSNNVFSSPAKFYTLFADQNGKMLYGDFKMDRVRRSNGFFAHMELQAWRAGQSNVYHGPQVMICYHKNEVLTANLFSFGYFFRVKPSVKTNTGFSLDFQYYPQSNFSIELANVAYPDSGTYRFNNKDYGDTVKIFFTEKKSSFCAELNYHLGFLKKFDLRFSAGVMFSIKSSATTKVVSENSEQEFKASPTMYLSNNGRANFPLINPAYFFFRVGIYVLEFKKN